MTGHSRLGPGREFDAVRALLGAWGESAVGIGDDGALLDVPAGARLVVSTDSTVEDVHFRREWLEPDEIGWRATMAALSDLAAMGAAPLGMLLALTVPGSWRTALDGIARGIGAAAARTGTPIVGGDLSGGERLALSITVLGQTKHPLTRAGARPGDTLYLTGALGAPGAALAAWQRGARPRAEDRARFARPEARIAAGRWFVAHGAHAAVDVSDGLAGDLAHLAAASAVRCVLRLDAIPCVPGVAVLDAVASGEEYELLVASPALDTAAFAAAHDGLALTAVGAVEAPDEAGVGESVAEQRGRRVALPAAHDHFAAR
ncbi:MAG: thiamine-phosphate kinase [Gemmatimonadota bacterium]|nr:thiamine-phosphate kinase [Gemmatimonadota bacterium]